MASICFCFLSFSITTKAQQQDDFKYEFKGVVRDQNSAVVPGLTLKIDEKNTSLTDINGEFNFLLPVGDYVITTGLLFPSQFRAFIKITKTGLNPGYLEFVIDSSALACSKDEKGNDLPKILSSVLPTYPAAAKAIRAIGEVAVLVKINEDGGVSSAKALRGHPLLRTASIVAAEKFKFEPAKNNPAREVTLAFVFLPGEHEKPKLARYSCSYRAIVNYEQMPIDISSTKK